MAQAFKRKLSSSTDGKPIKVAATATLGTAIHTAIASTTAGTFDEIWLWAYNSDTSPRILTIEFGGASVPDQNIKITLQPNTGLIPILPGLILQNGMIVSAFCDVANKVTLSGFINYITD